jgi:hypothetical protein
MMKAEEVEIKEPEGDPFPSLTHALQDLPILREDIYLRLQALNLGVVDSILTDWERELLAEYYDKERTPIASATVVAAVSQLWVFGLYELLRTWRQRVNDVLGFATWLNTVPADERQQRIEDKKRQIREAAADPSFAGAAVAPAFERAGTDAQFRDSVRLALDRSEVPFRRLEAVRVHLAKHEVPKSGSYGVAPGYSRIDEVTQSILWEVPLGDKEIELTSRRSLVDGCRKFGTDPKSVILPVAIQQQLKNLGVPAQSYGVKRVILTLNDGAKHDALVAWNRQILKLADAPPQAIDPAAIVAVAAVA